jgi:cellulose synthase/poly-beta-1,6-N-acetylglucosamine synthase-like glycosyltransferase
MPDLIRNILKLIFWLCLTATVYTYFLYPLLLMTLSRLTRRRRHRRQTIISAPASFGDELLLPSVVMVISAYNEEDVLPAKLANCRAIDYPADKIHFLIGSDGSDDGTAKILRRISDDCFTTLHSRIRWGKVRMLNRLMEMPLKSDVVVFSDANTMYQPDAIRHLVRHFHDPKVGCVIGKLELTASSGDSDACQPEGLYWRYENRIKRLENVFGAVPSINGGIFAIRRHLFEALPGQTITEDQVLGMKIMVRGYLCRFAEEACARETVSDWAGELRRRIRISAGNFQSLFLVPQILHPRLGRVCFAFVSHKLLRWLVPFFLAGMLIANILLVGQPFYGSTLLLQSLFYLSGLIGATLGKLGSLPKILAVPRYFIAMNAAILLGLARFLTRRQPTTWAKAIHHRPD